jgi:ABC-type transporter Mla subunit MlaD
MEKKPSDRQDKMLNQQKEMLIQEISKCSEDISDNQTKIGRYNKIITEKFDEVEKLKADLDALAKTEQKSKEDIKNILRKVTGLFNGLDVILRNVQQQMVTNVKASIKKNLQQFKKFLNAVEGMEEVNEVLKQTELLERDFRNGNNDTLKIFQKNLHDFDAGIVKIVDLLNPAIKKIQLNLSLKKFDDFWAIYNEINQCLDQIGEWSRLIAKTGAEKIYKVVVLQDLETFGSQKDQDALMQMLSLWQEKTTESESLLDGYTKANNELKLNLTSIETEWKGSRLRYQEKAMLIDVNIANAFKHYTAAQTSLNQISHLLQDGENALNQDAEQKITELMKEFRNKIQNFGNIFGKTQKVTDEKKRAQLQAEITKKFEQFVANMQNFFDGMIRDITVVYTQNIEKIVGELNAVIKITQKELNAVRTNIDGLQISASKDILLELLELSHDQVKIHQESVEGAENEMMHHTFISNATKKVQELQKNIDRMFGIHQAKLNVTQILSSQTNGNPLLQWEIRNEGRIAFSDFKTAMVTPKEFSGGKIQPAANSMVNCDLGTISIWTVPKLDRQEGKSFSNEIQKITPESITIEKQRMNDLICSYHTSMYRKSGNAVLLKIRESNGMGEVELQNPSEKTILWNVILQFQPNDAIPDLPLMLLY